MMNDMASKLWFDVGFKRYTTERRRTPRPCQLWFDVGFKRYTTNMEKETIQVELWFDVGFKRYTTRKSDCFAVSSCGLM